MDPQNNQMITYSEIVQLLSQRTVPFYPGGEYKVNVISQEPKYVPILEKFVKYAPEIEHMPQSDFDLNRVTASIGGSEACSSSKRIDEMHEEESSIQFSQLQQQPSHGMRLI